MKYFYRLIGASSYEQMNECLAKLVQEEEISRNEKRKVTLEQIEKLDVRNDADKIQSLLINLNRDLTTSYEKEKFVLEFVNSLKS
jgi:hypothetical protein